MKAILTSTVLLISILCSSQDPTTYDSTSNYLKEQYELYINLSLIVRPLDSAFNNSGYSGFYSGRTTDFSPNNSYYGDKLGFTKEEKLKLRKFKVVDVIKQEGYFTIGLVLSDEKEILTYAYSTSASEEQFPFFTEGFLKKKAKELENQCIVVKSHLIKDSTVINTQNPYWYCKSIEISDLEGGIVLRLEDATKNRITVPYDALFTYSKGYYYCEEYNDLIKKHGAKFADNLLNSKVEIGMKKALCAIILGKPDENINARAGSQSAEVWNIGKRAYYFTNNRLSSIH